jgi:hypothetical protein
MDFVLEVPEADAMAVNVPSLDDYEYTSPDGAQNSAN